MFLTNFQRSIISRTAMAVLGLALLYGACATLRVSHQILLDDLGRNQQFSSHPVTDIDDSRLPFFIGVALLCLAIPFLLGAILPTRVLYKLPFFAEPNAVRETVDQYLQ